MLSKSHRKQIRRLDRDYFATGRATLHEVRTEEELRRGLELLEGLHQRRRESLEIAAGRLALDIDHRLSDIEEQLLHGSGVRLMPEGPQGKGLLYVPGELPQAHISAAFAGGDALQFQRRDFTAAAAEYR